MLVPLLVPSCLLHTHCTLVPPPPSKPHKWAGTLEHVGAGTHGSAAQRTLPPRRAAILENRRRSARGEACVGEGAGCGHGWQQSDHPCSH